jgi:hypothetical protein
MPERPKERHQDSRRRRLSMALRENLKRRKAQARERDRAPEPAAQGAAVPHDSAGFDDDNRGGGENPDGGADR